MSKEELFTEKVNNQMDSILSSQMQNKQTSESKTTNDIYVALVDELERKEYIQSNLSWYDHLFPTKEVRLLKQEITVLKNKIRIYKEKDSK